MIYVDPLTGKRTSAPRPTQPPDSPTEQLSQEREDAPHRCASAW